MIQELGEMGYAYEMEGSVYFRVTRDDDYGKLSRRALEDELTRVAPRELLLHPVEPGLLLLLEGVEIVVDVLEPSAPPAAPIGSST